MTPRIEPMTLPEARRLLLAGQALLGTPPGGLRGLVQQLGFVQMDSINVVERAHHLILGSRLETYEPAQFDALMGEDRFVFEHWTHDASAIPLQWYRHWKPRFKASGQRILSNAWWLERVGGDAKTVVAMVLKRIREEGPLMSADFEHKGSGESAWWGWKPQKAALEFLWHTGDLAVARRVHFHKVYDLPSRVFPEAHAAPAPTARENLDWACREALDRLGVATPRELAQYFNAVEPADAAKWCASALKAGRIVAVELQDDKPRPAFAVPDWRERLEALPEPPAGLRLLCPFDPILRDRARALRLFGFDYRFEAFTPEAKRLYGYYVLPILEGERLVGRLDPKFHRDKKVLEIKGVWWEQGVRATKARGKLLRQAVEHLASRLGARDVVLP